MRIVRVPHCQAYAALKELSKTCLTTVKCSTTPKRKHVMNGMLSPVEFETIRKPNRRGLRNWMPFKSLSAPDDTTHHIFVFWPS